MKFTRLLKENQRPWVKIALVISFCFLALSLVTWVLGRWVIEDNSERILEQRLVIVQIIADDIDRKVERAAQNLEQIRLLADFNPVDLDLNDELEALSTHGKISGIIWEEIVFLDSMGEVVLSYPSARYLRGTNISHLPEISSALQLRSVQFSSPFQVNQGENDLFIRVTIPIFDTDKFIGLLSGTLDLDGRAIYESLQNAITLGKTAHAILVDEQGRALVSTFELPFLSSGEHPTFYRHAILAGIPTVETVPFELDYPDEPLGHLHVMAFVPLKNIKWGLAMGGDVVTETFAGVRRLSLILVSLSAISIAGVWAGALFGTRQLLNPMGAAVARLDLVNQVANAKNWESLVNEIVKVPSHIAPVLAAGLFVHDKHQNEFEKVAEWIADGYSPSPIWPVTSLEMCRACTLLTEFSSFPCKNEAISRLSDQLKGYCVPLIHQESLVGLLHFILPSTDLLAKDQLSILNSVASDLAIAIESFQLQKNISNQVEITQKERLRIARQLHDNLGQNISYLRLKLDQFTGDDALREISAIKKDLERMRDVAEETYQQVRGTMETLQAETVPHFENALLNQAKKYSERSQFELEFSREGHPFPLPGPTQRQALDITKEVFGNIEKHAKATRVVLQIFWREETLQIRIKDNGKGFIVGEYDESKHFGLGIMRERINALSGEINISSTVHSGTQISITLHKNAPYPARQG